MLQYIHIYIYIHNSNKLGYRYSKVADIKALVSFFVQDDSGISSLVVDSRNGNNHVTLISRLSHTVMRSSSLEALPGEQLRRPRACMAAQGCPRPKGLGQSWRISLMMCPTMFGVIYVNFHPYTLKIATTTADFITLGKVASNRRFQTSTFTPRPLI